MKTRHFLSIYLLIAALLICNTVAYAQNGDENGNNVEYITITGVVKDKISKKNLGYVNVYAVGSNVGTITNENGEFTLKINKALKVSEIRLSIAGYYNSLISLKSNGIDETTFYMAPESIILDEIMVFTWHNPRDLVKIVMEKISDNYPMQPNMLIGFYRETVQKQRRYINISEAVVEIYKDAYNRDVERDKVRVLKGRKLLSPKRSDTLTVTFVGGPTMPVYLDVIKNPDILLDLETLNLYSFRMGGSISIDDRLHYSVRFEPQVIVDYPLYAGTMYIEQTSLALTRIEFKMDMTNKHKVSKAILKDKPAGLRFTPEDVVYVVTYKQQDGKTFLNYIRSEIRFKCDWKRRLFATNYEVIAETVITDRNEQNVIRIQGKEIFGLSHSLSQEVELYLDENFWSNYNIIEPTESLENAVNRLKKQNLRTQ